MPLPVALSLSLIHIFRGELDDRDHLMIGGILRQVNGGAYSERQNNHHGYQNDIDVYKRQARISDNTAFFLLGDLVEFGKTEQIFSTPRDKRTEDYITGRFG